MSQYEVTGPFPFRGHEPGSAFTAEPDEVIERAIARGSISHKRAPKPKPPAGRKSSRAKRSKSTSKPASPEKE